MNVNGVELNADLADVLAELQTQMRVNGYPYLQKLKPSGSHVMCQCPYHKGGTERRLSAGISVKTGVLHCFACGEVRGLSEVVSHCFGRDGDMGAFGWRWLLQSFGTVGREERKDVALDFVRRGAVGIGSRASAAGEFSEVGADHPGGRPGFVGEAELDSYRYKHPYWAKRGITDEWLIELFDLGYDRRMRCVTFPVRDGNGNCLFVARRSVEGKWFNYPKNAEKPIYGAYELKLVGERPQEIIICESMLDALSCWQWGKRAVATNGTQVSGEQFRQLMGLPCRKFVLAMDNDAAGRKANVKLRERIGGRRIVTEYVLPEGRKDVNELTEGEFRGLKEIFGNLQNVLDKT